MSKLTLIYLGASIAVVLSHPNTSTTSSDAKRCGQSRISTIELKSASPPNNTSEYRELPWLVAILNDANYRCSGALIHRNVVLTAAHCVHKKETQQLKVYAGARNMERPEDNRYYDQRRGVSKYVVHEDFNSGEGWNDYALIFLRNPIKITERVDLVCLPEAHDIFDGIRCFESKWDKSQLQYGRFSRFTSKTIQVPVVSPEVCQNSLRTASNQAEYVLDKSFICAGTEAGTITSGHNGGSPLSCPLGNDSTHYVLAGILSWGIRDGNDVLRIFANVAEARTWIDRQLAANNL